ncbi:MAG: IPT/TIG domain-containing protein, partial [Planctomycetota bacterium]
GRSALRAALAFTVFAALAALGAAHVRLRYSVDGTALFWSNSESVPFQIQSDGSDDISDGSHVPAIRAAAQAWNMAYGSRARLVEGPATNRVDWQSASVQLILFDEDNASGFFPGASSTVAITPVTFFTDGRIADADVIFNGKTFRFTTDGEPGHFDVEDVAAHELGHFLGLDHSGVCGATMYPYVDSTVILHRSLSYDDVGGMRSIYPAQSFGRVNGSVVRASDSSAVAGAHVVALDADGRVAGAILSTSSGAFALTGLDGGTYTLYADPLDQPVSGSNLGGGQTVETDFQTTALGTVSVPAGGAVSLGTVALAAQGSVQLGRVSDDFPQRIVLGETVTRTVRGAGLVAGSTLTCSDPGLSFTNVSWFDSAVAFDVEVPAGAVLGHVDLTATAPGGDRDTLVGGLEITPPDPTVVGVSPAAGDLAGGASITVSGAGFRPGARVVLGGRIYRDGDASGCQIVDANTITLTTGETLAGRHDVVVVDETGVEGRLGSAFAVDVAPIVTTTFPSVGAATGGTRIVLTGDHFVPGTQVTIDGQLQTQVFVASPTRLDVVTTGGTPGGPHVLRVISPSAGFFAETAFTYVDTPDPEVTLVTPDEVDRSGGVQVSLFGDHFDASTRVVFGVDPRTGSGGRTGSGLDLVDDGLVRVTAPSGALGTTSILVESTATGQSITIEEGFTFTGELDVDDGGGGGCAAVVPPVPGPPSARDVLGGGGWILLAFLIAFARARRAAVPIEV